MLNFRVRNGIGWVHAAKSTKRKDKDREQKARAQVPTLVDDSEKRSSPRPISTGQLNTLPRLHSQPIDPVVYRGSYSHEGMGKLILESASRLDAFSAYPFRT